MRTKSSTSTPNTQSRRNNPHPPAPAPSSSRGIKASATERSMDEARADDVQLSSEVRSVKPQPSAPPTREQPSYENGVTELDFLVWTVDRGPTMDQALSQPLNSLLQGLADWAPQEGQPQ